MIRAVAIAAAALLAANAAHAEAHVVRIDASGWPGVVDSLPKEIADGEAFWVWSDDCAPQRVTATHPRANCAASEKVALQVSSSDRGSLDELEIRWGSEEMLRELPDSLLPIAMTDATGRATPRLPKSTQLFARVAGRALASRWIEVSSPTTTLRAVHATPVDIELRDADGVRARHAILELRTTDVAPPHDLPFRGAGDGVIAIPPLPSDAWVRLLGWSESAAPAIAIASTDRLPPSLQLHRGYALSGTVIDRRKSPLGNVRIAAVARAAPDAEIERHARSDAHGRFRIEGLDRREVQWLARMPGFGAIARVAHLEGDLDLGAIVLAPARDVRVTVRNQRRQPIEGALIRTIDGAEATTRADGIAMLKEVSADAFDARVFARGHLAREVRIGEEAAQPPIVLRDAARVRAHVVRASDGAPAGPGTVAVELDGRKTMAEFGERGDIDVDDLTAGAMSLEIRANGAAPFRLPARTIADGEVVDLGVLSLAPGLAITGRVLDTDSSAPLGGANVHVLRPSTFGPLLSYARRDWVSAESREDGTFRVDGLAPAVYALWIDAPGRAPVVRTGVEVSGDDAAIGDVTLPAGRTLHIDCEPVDRCGTTATAVLAGADWLPITAPMTRGSTTLAPLPPGTLALRLSDRGGIVHEREVRIAGDAPTTEVHIRLTAVRVSGTILRGGKPVAGGMLLFRPSGTAQRLVQIEHQGSAGSLGSDFLGTVMSAGRADVGDDGRFVLADATPGDYAVTWSAGPSQSPAVQLSIPETDVAGVVVELRGGTIEGIALDERREPATSVTVTAEQNGALAQTFAAPDGTFSLAGLGSGGAVVRAETRTLRAEQEVQLDEARPAHVQLTLKPREEHSLTITVRANGAPIANALVFLRENGAMSAATTSGDGTATLRLLRADGTIDAAVFSPAAGWAFLAPREERYLTSVAIDLPAATGVLSIVAAGPVSLVAPTGFPLEAALPLLGLRSLAALPLRLPEGLYRASSGGVTKDVDLTASGATLDFTR